ncbi:hypothetical protein BX666DRAFT_1957951, partial [Dichotomocladium elegans]
MVYINDVHVLAVPRSKSSMTAEEMEEREYQQKMRKLANSELLKTAPQTTDSTTAAKNETFANQLMTKILNNLQFKVTNIHVRYEDDVSVPGHRFAAGITLSELSAISTDENWIPQTIGDAVNTIHKMATLESLSIYWNTDTRSLAGLEEEESKNSFRELIATKSHVPSEHQYMLKPVSGTGRIKMNKNFGGEVPKVDATLLFDELSFVIDNEQYRDAVLMVDLFHSYLKRQKYLHLHPGPDVTPKSSPLQYFQFAGKAVLSEIHDRNYRWTWDHFKTRRDERLKYIECYVESKLNRATPEQEETLDNLEHKLSYEDIRFYRSIAKSKLKREKAILAAEEERRKKEEAAQHQKNSGWLSSWWYGSGNADGSSSDTGSELVITDEQVQEFYDAIEYDDDKAAVAAAIDFPKDTMMFCLRTTLNTGSFTVKRDPHSEKPVDVVSLVFDTVLLGATQYVESFKVTAALGDLRLYDGVTKNTQYRQLIGAKQKATEEEILKLRRRSNVDPQLLRYSSIQDPFFSVVFEHKPLDGRADNGVALIMRNIDIAYNPLIIREVISFFRPPETSADSINALIEVAGDTFEDLKNQTRVNLEYALENHTTLDLRVDMDAPVIVIPEDCTASDSRGIVLDAGHINIESKLAPPEVVKQMKNKRAADYTTEDYVEFRSLMYDKFTVHLTQTKIVIGESVRTCLEQVRNPIPENNYMHFVDRIDMTFLLEMCIVQNSPEMCNFKMSGHLPLLSVNFSDTKYRSIMQIPKLIEASGIISNNTQDVPASTNEYDGLHEHPNHEISDTRRRSNFMHTKLWNQEEEYVLESDTEDTSSDRLGNTNTAPSSISVMSTRNKKQPNSNQRIFELNFRVDMVRANILEAQGPRKELLLCDLVLQHLSVDYCLRPFDMFVNLSLKSLAVMDRMEHGNEFKFLATSDQDVLHFGESSPSESAKDLVNVEYIRVVRTSPEYLTKYSGMDQTVSVALSTLNFIVTRSSVLTLHNFVLNTFVTNENEEMNLGTFNTHQQSQTFDLEQQKEVQTSKRPMAEEQSIRVTLLLDSVNFIFNNDGVRIATAELSHGDMTIVIQNATTKVAAKFANLTLTDDLSSQLSKNGEDGHPAYSNQILTIQGEELIDFRYETYLHDEASYPGYDQSVFVRMGSAQFTFREEPVKQLLLFLSKFAAMKSVYDRARQAALESAHQFQQSATKIHFDVIIKTPVVLFPQMHQNPKDMVVAYLGEIGISNEFVEEDGGILNVTTAGIRSISLTSKYYLPGTTADRQQIQSLPIVDKIDITFDIKSLHDPPKDARPDIDMVGTISDVRMHLTDRQFTFLIDAANMFSRVFSEPPASSQKDSPQSLGSNTTSQKEVQVARRQSQVVPPKISSLDQPRLRMALTAKTIGLNLYMPGQTNPVIGLSRIALSQSSMQLSMFKDNTLKIDMKVTSMTVNDTRPNVKSKFKEIMPSAGNDHHFQMELDISAPEPNRNAIAFITLTDPKIVLSLDHSFLLFRFFMTPFTPRADSISARKSDSSPQTADRNNEEEDSGAMSISFRVNIMNPEFILLANPDDIASEAVVLSADEFAFSRQTVMSLAARQIGMFLCRMDMRQTSTLRFIQPFDVTLSMNNNAATAHPKTELEVDVEALVLRLSSRDALLVTDIFNKAFELYNAAIKDNYGPTKLMDTSQQLSSEMDTIVNTVEQTLMDESLRASFQGLQIILIEEVHEMPMVDINLKAFSVNVANWSRSLSVDVSLSSYMNYFNIKNSHWEPLIEPWDFKVQLSRRSTKPEDPLQIRLISDYDLNVNITHTLLETALATLTLLDKQKELAFSGERGSVAPYRIRNCTGYRIHVWNAQNAGSGGPDVKILEDGAEMAWWFEDWRERRETTAVSNNMLCVQLDCALWETLRNISVDTQGEHMFSLRPRIQDVQHRIVFDCKLVNNLKIVTIRSTMTIENNTLLPIDLAILDASGMAIDGPIVKIAPGENYALPIEKAYHNRFCVRPDAGFGYTWTKGGLHWKDFVRNNDKTTSIMCRARNGDMPNFFFQVHARLDKKDILFGHYPVMSIRLSAPIEIENLLPHSFNFRIIDKTARQDFSSFLRKGGTTPIHVIENGHLLLINISLIDSGYVSNEFAIINTRGTDDLDLDDTIQLTSSDDSRLTLRINTIDIPESGGAKKYVIYCPYVVMNKSGCAISIKTKPAWQSSMFSGSNGPSIFKVDSKPEPYMLSYPKRDNGNRSLIQVGGSDWSEPISFEAVGSSHGIALPKGPQGTDEIHIGINVQEGHGKYKLTKIVTFTPRFVLINRMIDDIRYREPETRIDHILEAGQRISLHQLRRNTEKQLSVKLPGINNTWSAPFNIQDIGITHVRLDSADGSTVALMRVTIVLENATVFIILQKEEDNAWPYLLVNDTEEDMTFYQEDSVILRDDYADPRLRNHKTKRYRLPAGQSVPYSWDMPALKSKRIILNIFGRERAISMQEIGSQPPFRHQGRDGGTAITEIDVKTHRTAQVLYLTPYNPSMSYFQPLSSQVSLASSSSQELATKEGFRTANVNTVVNFVMEIKFRQIGISLVNRKLQELVYTTFRGFELKLTDSTMYQSIRWNILWVQIDNQLHGTLFPILLYPTTMTRENSQEIVPTFQLGLDRVKDDSHGVLYFKYFSVLLQEMSLEMDEGFIFAVMDFFTFSDVAPVEGEDEENQWVYSADVPDVNPPNNETQLYFEMLNIQPIGFSLSFVRTNQANSEDERSSALAKLESGYNPVLDYALNVVTMALGNINGASLRFNALAVENLRGSAADLGSRITLHYSDQFVNQFHRLIGSADFLGNPVGLFNSVSSGVAELFYEPWQGIIYSDRPHDLGVGIARG